MTKTMATLGVALAATSAQAEDFEVGENTTMSLFGTIELKYNTSNMIENNQGDTESESGYEDNGSSLGVGVEHRFDNGLTGFAVAEFEHDANESDDSIKEDVAFAGLRGDFGEVRAGSFDNIYTEAIYDLIDPFETASLGEETVTEEDNQIAYYSPNFDGFSFELMARVKGDKESETGDNDQGVAGVVKYAADTWAIHAGFDDRGSNAVEGPNGDITTQDPVYGVGGLVSLTDDIGLGARYSVQENLEGSSEGDETAFYGASLSYDYGRGTVYGAVQEVDPDQGDSDTQFAAGVNYSIVDNLYVYSEYGSYDPADSDVGELDTQYEVGAIYEF